MGFTRVWRGEWHWFFEVIGFHKALLAYGCAGVDGVNVFQVLITLWPGEFLGVVAEFEGVVVAVAGGGVEVGGWLVVGSW